MNELQKIDRLIRGKPEAPERIYGWLNSQMSIARYWGGLTYMGCSYHVVPNEEGQPLVRADVLAREAKERNIERLAAKQFEQRKFKQAQGELL